MTVKIDATYTLITTNFGHLTLDISIGMDDKFPDADLHKMLERVKQAAVNSIQRDDAMTTHERKMKANAPTKEIT